MQNSRRLEFISCTLVALLCSGAPVFAQTYDAVILNGRVMDSVAQKVMAGLPIRYAPEANGRHVPASTKQWVNAFTIDDGALDKVYSPGQSN